MEIRQCRKEDLDEIYEIERLSFKYPYPPFIFYSYLGKLFFVLEDNKKIIGYVVGDKERNLVVSIAIHPKYRRRGYGKMLMEHLLKHMNGEVVLQVRKSNKGAIQFYKKLGFKEKKELKRYYMDGENAILMVKKLD